MAAEGYNRPLTVGLALRIELDKVQDVLLLHAAVESREGNNDVGHRQAGSVGKHHDLSMLVEYGILRRPMYSLDDVLSRNMLSEKFAERPVNGLVVYTYIQVASVDSVHDRTRFRKFLKTNNYIHFTKYCMATYRFHRGFYTRHDVISQVKKPFGFEDVFGNVESWFRGKKRIYEHKLNCDS